MKRSVLRGGFEDGYGTDFSAEGADMPELFRKDRKGRRRNERSSAVLHQFDAANAHGRFRCAAGCPSAEKHCHRPQP